MPFDAIQFRRAPYAVRTATVRIEELRPWFSGADPDFIVRGLTGIELAQITEALANGGARAELIESLLNGGEADRVLAILREFGLSDDVPAELCRYHELIIRGTVEPVIDRETSVFLAERYPVDHKALAMAILRLTGQGQISKKKLPDFTQTPASEPA